MTPPIGKLTQTWTAPALVGHSRSHTGEARFFPALANPHIRRAQRRFGTPPRLETFDSSTGRIGGDGHADASATHCHSGGDRGSPCWRARLWGVRQTCRGEDDPIAGHILDELTTRHELSA